ncbi:hypothetical protein GHK79_10565 [Enterococcus faecium]|uniref:Uncharacterized protein n=2 Tax=Enterococcus faecium TaxID=1352 RepID=A0A828ZYF3_ENTFC|nr:hypothetical protein OIE_03156 [Enterococcus faecium EnGen0003]MBD9760435.1 hypothetical protein [Enterococcus faecium]MBD9782539.1 hypothetical protein [Enterococcus faecium]MBL3708266.1 hypothetical protein [Enterococcus faecium]NTQ91021.1 hypothetical protein [Enterococcus faecium]
MVTCSFNLEEKIMAINNVIDLDAKLSLTKSVKIAGKVYEITISDEVDQALTNLNIDIPVQMETMQSRMNKLEEVDDTTSDQYKNFVQQETENMRVKSVETLDRVLGDGEGERIYKYYNSSTKALFSIISLLQEEFRNIMVERKKTADRHYKNKHKKK